MMAIVLYIVSMIFIQFITAQNDGVLDPVLLSNTNETQSGEDTNMTETANTQEDTLSSTVANVPSVSENGDTSSTSSMQQGTQNTTPKDDVTMSEKDDNTKEPRLPFLDDNGEDPPAIGSSTEMSTVRTTTESEEQRQDRELFYITIAICSGTVVLVFSVAIITYYTHRELPARVDIRKFSSYSNV